MMNEDIVKLFLTEEDQDTLVLSQAASDRRRGPFAVCTGLVAGK